MEIGNRKIGNRKGGNREEGNRKFEDARLKLAINDLRLATKGHNKAIQVKVSDTTM